MDQKRSTPEDSLVALKDHGRIEVRLKEILDSRGMKRNTLARAIGCRFEAVSYTHLDVYKRQSESNFHLFRIWIY